MEDLLGALPAQALARPAVERSIGSLDLLAGGPVQARALGEEVPEEAVGVLVGALLPGVVRQAEETGIPSSSCIWAALANSLPRSSVRVSSAPPESDDSMTAVTSAAALRGASPPAR